MAGFNESILHTVGRAVGSGAWQGIGARAMQAFQNARALKYQREKQLADENYRTTVTTPLLQDENRRANTRLTDDIRFRNEVTTPVTKQNAASRAQAASASELNAQTEQTRIGDIVSGAAAKRAAQNKIRADLLPQDANSLDFGAADIETALKAAQQRKQDYDVRQHTRNAFGTGAAQSRQHAADSLFNQLTGSRPKGAGLAPEEWDRRQRLMSSEMTKRTIARALLDQKVDPDDVKEILNALDQTYSSTVAR